MLAVGTLVNEMIMNYRRIKLPPLRNDPITCRVIGLVDEKMLCWYIALGTAKDLGIFSVYLFHFLPLVERSV